MASARSATVVLFEDYEEVVTGAGVEGLEAEVVEDEEVGAAEGLDEAGWLLSPRASAKEFIKFLGAVERVPGGKVIHAVLDNYASHKHPEVFEWLTEHPRWTFHFTPTSGSWLNAVENFFSVITRRAIRRGVFKSVADLQRAIRDYIQKHNAGPRPFVWTKPAETILEKLRRFPVPSESHLGAPPRPQPA